MFVLLQGPKVRRRLPALAAQPRAFSSLLSLPSRAQSVIKAFRRQGIGFRRCCQYCPLFLSRLESLFAAQKVFQIFRGRAGRDCVIYSVSLSLHSINPTDSPDSRISVRALVILSVGLCKSRKDRLSPARTFVRPAPAAPYGLASYGICRQFPHPLSRTRKPPSNTTGQRELTDASASVLNSPSCPAQRVCSWVCMQCAASSGYRLQICY